MPANICIVLGQPAFVALMLPIDRAARIRAFRWPHRAAPAPAFLAGSLRAYWTVQRTVMTL
jgi:hypothetical protein